MSFEYAVMVGGEAGQGIQSVGSVLSRYLARTGFYIFADQDYESRVRGGHNFFRVRAADYRVLAPAGELDCLVAMNRDTLERHWAEVKLGGVIIIDPETSAGSRAGKNTLEVPLTRLAEEAAGNKLMTNTVATGAVVGLAGGSLPLLSTLLAHEFGGAGKAVVAANEAAAAAGYKYALEHDKNFLKELPAPPPRPGKWLLLNGNEALAMGALSGGCRFFAGYPMTPASSIMEFFADKGRDYNAVTMHVEDEIAAMNMVVGAGFAGVRAMTATSGGGFSLMTEGLSLAGITETPVVVVIAQRPGPATGLPTRTEQGELEYAIHAGHGEFPRAVLAPATAEEAFYAGARAFNLAEKYQIPVIILTDQHLAASYVTVPRFEAGMVSVDRGDLVSDAVAKKGDYKRYMASKSGVSPRAWPMMGTALVVADSDEHDEAGHMIEDAETRNQQNHKRMQKLYGLAADITPPISTGEEQADILLIGWGSTFGAIKEAAAIIANGGTRVRTLHLTQVYPFPAVPVAEALGKTAKSIVIENNATSPLSRLIRRETGLAVSRAITKADGRPFVPQALAHEIIKKAAH
ncbi:2-oxoacid:acceptor oxidoreductase subunit alpha [Chloroflexota bacterium]